MNTHGKRFSSGWMILAGLGVFICSGLAMVPVDAQQADAAASGSQAMQTMMKPGGAPDAEGVVQAYQDALSQGNRAKALALLAADAHIIEGGQTQSVGEYAAGHLAADIGFMKNATLTVLSRASMAMGAMAHVTSERQITVSRNGEARKMLSHEIMMLKKVDGDWKIASISWASERPSE